MVGEEPTKTTRGGPGRVAAVHRQTRRGLLVALGFAVAAVVATIVPHDSGAWLPLHLFLLGALLNAVSATTQMLAVTWSAAPAPPSSQASGQRWVLSIGVVAVVVGRETDRVGLVMVGGALVIVALGALVVLLSIVWARAVAGRFRPAIEGYVAAAVLGLAGTAIGVSLATDENLTQWARWRATHVTINVFGLIGIVVAATLPYFSATQARRKMHRAATPTAIRGVLAVLAGATVAAAVGQARGWSSTVTVALFIYAAALVVLAVLLPVYDRRALRWAGPRLLQLEAGLAWWIAMTVTVAILAGHGEDDRPALRALIVGGYGQILVASLASLGPVLRGGGHERLTAGFARTRSWIALVAGNVAAVAALLGLPALLVVALVVWLADVLVRAVSLRR